MRARARTALVGIAMAALSALQGCTESMVMEGVLGIDKYNVNQCLLQPQPTHSGVTLPKGTRGTFQEDGGRAIFFVDSEDGGVPVMYDITGLGWLMRTCRAGD
ncbi:MAG: hypothetical protein OXI20_17220 [Rhodospirillales bacterium]|nr:hypothetical protein [Rhodospirillales bacterium]